MTIYEKYNYTNAGKHLDKIEAKSKIYQGFETKGKLDFASLEELTKNGFNRLMPCLESHRTEPKETWVYSSKSALFIIYANYAKDYHKIDISLKANPENSKTQIYEIKSLLEKKLNVKLSPRNTDSSNLIEEPGKN